jgi:hypothetical protein
LQDVITGQRLNGLTAILAHMKKLATNHLWQSYFFALKSGSNVRNPQVFYRYFVFRRLWSKFGRAWK